jgi:hypothetical protein
MDLRAKTPNERMWSRVFCYVTGSHRNPRDPRKNFVQNVQRDGSVIHMCLDCGYVTRTTD